MGCGYSQSGGDEVNAAVRRAMVARDLHDEGGQRGAGGDCAGTDGVHLRGQSVGSQQAKLGRREGRGVRTMRVASTLFALANPLPMPRRMMHIVTAIVTSAAAASALSDREMG